MAHIKRDGGFLCNQKKSKYNWRFITFSKAHKTILTDSFCKDCVKRYYDIVGNMKNPIIVK